MKKLFLGSLMALGLFVTALTFAGQHQAEYVPPNLSPGFHVENYIPPEI